ncbi:MAG: type II toxin-antitoxin system Phd/YefM family antitoxin [bacterium]|nr:type II toxin-antitoxin system Phd/YefM family antitoxin [Candidatus Colisoma equi]
MPFVENTLPRPKMSEDVIPFTEYRRTLSDCLERTKRTHRPLFITQNGRATTVVMNISEYEQHEDIISQCQSYLDRANLSRDVAISRREFAEGKGIPARKVFADIRERLLARQQEQA